MTSDAYRKVASVGQVACCWGCVATVTHIYRARFPERVEFGHLCELHADLHLAHGDAVVWPLDPAPAASKGSE